MDKEEEAMLDCDKFNELCMAFTNCYDICVIWYQLHAFCKVPSRFLPTPWSSGDMRNLQWTPSIIMCQINTGNELFQPQPHPTLSRFCSRKGENILDEQPACDLQAFVLVAYKQV